jgi:hypothetical protein
LFIGTGERSISFAVPHLSDMLPNAFGRRLASQALIQRRKIRRVSLVTAAPCFLAAAGIAAIRQVLRKFLQMKALGGDWAP